MGGSPSVSESRGDGLHKPASPWAMLAGEYKKRPRNRIWEAAEPPAAHLPSPGWLSQWRPNKDVGTRFPALRERDKGGTGEQHCCGSSPSAGRRRGGLKAPGVGVTAWTWAALRLGHRPGADPRTSGFLLPEKRDLSSPLITVSRAHFFKGRIHGGGKDLKGMLAGHLMVPEPLWQGAPGLRLGPGPWEGPALPTIQGCKGHWGRSGCRDAV